MTKELSYEEQRQKNIEDNAALLRSLGLDAPAPRAKPKRVMVPKTPLRKAPATKRRVVEVVLNGTPRTPRTGARSEAETPGSTTSDASTANGLRRSGRSRGTVDYSDAGLERVSASRESSSRPPWRVTLGKRGYVGGDEAFVDDDEDANNERQRKAQKLGVRLHNPKRFGHIPGVEVGTWWPSRMDASTAAVHAPTVAGISGNAEEGAWSVALSGGYADDVDLGEAFTYTGSGGRDLKGTKQSPKNLRTAPQTFDQSFDDPRNASLKVSAETRKPVRVIRGFKLDSAYAPAEGYRYDGLYIVERAWLAKGLTKGLKVCRYAFKRVPGQPPLPERNLEAEAAEAEADETE